MPIFEYVCQKCEHSFEALVRGKERPSCPSCQSLELTPQLSVFAVPAKSSANGMAPATSACGSCGDPRGPGSCSLPDVD